MPLFSTIKSSGIKNFSIPAILRLERKMHVMEKELNPLSYNESSAYFSNAFDALNAAFKKNRFVFLSGESGAGKTTLIRNYRGQFNTIRPLESDFQDKILEKKKHNSKPVLWIFDGLELVETPKMFLHKLVKKIVDSNNYLLVSGTPDTLPSSYEFDFCHVELLPPSEKVAGEWAKQILKENYLKLEELLDIKKGSILSSPLLFSMAVELCSDSEKNSHIKMLKFPGKAGIVWGFVNFIIKRWKDGDSTTRVNIDEMVDTGLKIVGESFYRSIKKGNFETVTLKGASSGYKSFDLQQFLKILKGVGLLSQIDEKRGQFKISHRLFAEFFAAWHLKDYWQNAGGNLISEKKFVQTLLDELKYITRDEMIGLTLSLLQNESDKFRKSIKLFLNKLKDEYNYRAAIEMSGKIGGEVEFDFCNEALKNGDTQVRMVAAKVLGRIDYSDRASNLLLKTIFDDSSWDVRNIAGESLEKICSDKVVEYLIKEAQKNSEKPSIRKLWFVIPAISSLRSVKPLLNALKDDNAWIRRIAADALAKIGSINTLDAMITALKDPAENVRWAAARALGKIGSKKAVDFLIESLKDKNRLVRKAVATALGEIGSKKAVTPLLKVLKYDSEDRKCPSARECGEELMAIGKDTAMKPFAEGWVSWSAAMALAKINSPEVLNSLIDLLKDHDEDVRWLAVKALEKIGGDDSLESLIKALNDVNSDVRKAAAVALGKINSRKVLKLLIDNLKINSNSKQRRAVARALGETGLLEAVEPLISLLKDEEVEVRRAAVEALKKIGSEKAVKPLIGALKDTDNEVRITAARALGEIGSTEAVESLFKMMKDDDEWVQYAAARALEKIGSPKTVTLLIEELKSSKAVNRQKAAEVLGNIGLIIAVEPLLSVLKDADFRVRREAIKALGKIGSKKAIKPLIESLKDENEEIRKIAAKALGKIGSKDAIKPLTELLEDPDGIIRWTAVEALGEIGAHEAVNSLIKALNDPDEDVEKIAVASLGKCMSNFEEINALLCNAGVNFKIASSIALNSMMRIYRSNWCKKISV